MSDELERASGTPGIDRRDFMRKSALVGGMVWAAPAMTTLGSRAFAFTPNGEGNGNGDGGDTISNFAFIIRNGLTTYKYDNDEAELEGTKALMPCVGGLKEKLSPLSAYTYYTDEWCAADPGGALNLVSTTDDGNFVTYTITAPDTFTIGWIVVKEATKCYFKDLTGSTSFSFTKADALSGVDGWEETPSSDDQRCNQL